MSNNETSNETDLDWLARNVHVWEEDWTHVRKCPVHHEATWMASLSPNAEYKDWRTKQQWLARRAEFQEKPSWAHAPEWAEYMAQSPNGHWEFFAVKPRDEGWWRHPAWERSSANNASIRAAILGDWRNTLERRPVDLSESAVTERLQEATDNVLAAVPELKSDKYKFDQIISIEDNQELSMTQQQVKQDNGWFERGELPPVGEVCEAYIDYPPQWIETEIVAHKDGFAIGWCKSVMKGCHGDKAHEFRPLRTERDKAIDEMVCEFIDHHGDPKGGERYLGIAEKLYDAGYRKEVK